ncbi:MAG: tetratricopeptide repeat protein [Gammaproteobacteria bacterium]|nr:tetratricopeptide repeat protein [Gammaproteobacteria bacterium]
MVIRLLLLLTILLITVTGDTSAGELAEADKLTDQLIELSKQGKYPEAVRIGKKVLAIYEKSLGPEYPSTATSANNLAYLYQKMGDYARAKLLYQRVLSTRENFLGPKHPDTATSLNNLASLYYSMGRYDDAEPLFKRALAIWEKALGPDHPDTAQSLNNVALLYANIGRYDDAEPLHKRSLAIREKALGPDHPDTAQSLNNLASLYSDIGRYADAELLYKRSLAINEKSLGRNHPSTGTSLNKLAGLYYSVGRYAEAEPLYIRSLDILRKSLGPNHPSTGTSLNNLAVLYYSVGSYAEAEPLYIRSLDILRKSLGPDHFSTALNLNNLGELYRVMGRYDTAEPLFKSSLAILEKSLGPDHPYTVICLNRLAILIGTADSAADSLQLFQRGNRAQNRIMQTVFRISNEKEKLAFVEKSAWGYEATLSLVHRKLQDNQKALYIALDLVLSRKGIVLDAETRQREAIAKTLGQETKNLWVELSSRSSYLAKLLQSKPKNLTSEQYKSKLEEVQERIGVLEGILASESALVAEELEQREVTTKKLAKRMPKEGVLVEFVKIQEFDWDNGKWVDTERYLAFILHPDERIELMDLGDAEKLELDLKAMLAQLTDIPSNKRQANSQLNAANQLYTMLWSPLKKSIGNAETIIICPDGALNLIPFGALRGTDGKYLVESKTITYVTSGRDLVRSAKIKPESDLFLAANPMFDKVAKANTGKETSYRGVTRSRNFAMNFDPLPGTSLEAKAIPPLLPGKAQQVMTGANATEEAVLNTHRPKVLHLATHGFFLEDQPEIELSDNRIMGFDNKPKLPRGYENPLLRSGLAFAGANHANKEESGLDGLLTALEVSGMDLHGTDLVTLSACETGVGEVKTGEGVYGLRRAFALAGARNLLMSLWPVADQITADQMKRFYTLYGKGVNPSEALREAQLETIAKLRKEYGVAPPSLWAPFIMQGVPSPN